MIPDRDLDHVGEGLSLFINQYRDKPRFAAWASAYLKQCQQLEDAIYDVLIKRLIQNAQGIQCDVIGRIVGELRQGLDDATYKIFIQARVRINRSRGNTTDVLDVMGMITATSVIFGEYVPACLFIEALTIMDHDPVLIYTLLHDTKAAGVKLTLIVPTTNTKAFRPMSGWIHFAGTDGSTAAPSPHTTLTAPGTSFTNNVVGLHVVISGAATSANNGTFVIAQVMSAHVIRYTNPSSTADANNGAIVWSITQGIAPASNDANHACGDALDTSATLTSAGHEFWNLTGKSLTVAFDGQTASVFPFVAADFVDITNAKALEVVKVLNAPRRRRYFAEVVITTAHVECGSAETYNFTGGPFTLGVYIDGVEFILNFASTAFFSPAAVTAEQLAAVLEAQLVSLSAPAHCTATSGGTKVTITTETAGTLGTVQVSFGSAQTALSFPTSLVRGTECVKLSTWRVGTTASILVSAGGANDDLSFGNTIVTGTGDATFGLLSDAVTVRDPNAEPVSAPPEPPVILYVDPGSTP